MNDFQSTIINLSFTIYSNPGVYALLLGSGISRDAKILTGWEITLDIIRKIAVMEGELPRDYGKWYWEKYQETPEYSNLLKKLNITPTERANLLHPYFEPNMEEEEEGLRIPTPAHKCISRLVKYSYFCVILTTNFDRLLKRALEEVGGRKGESASSSVWWIKI